jgi:hypothetical protein
MLNKRLNNTEPSAGCVGMAGAGQRSSSFSPLRDYPRGQNIVQGALLCQLDGDQCLTPAIRKAALSADIHARMFGLRVKSLVRISEEGK